MAKWVQISEQEWRDLDRVVRITQVDADKLQLWEGTGDQDSFFTCSDQYAHALGAYLRKEGVAPATPAEPAHAGSQRYV